MGCLATERGGSAIVLPERAKILAHLISTRLSFPVPCRSWICGVVLKGDYSHSDRR